MEHEAGLHVLKRTLLAPVSVIILYEVFLGACKTKTSSLKSCVADYISPMPQSSLWT